MFKKILLVLILLIGVFAVVVVMQPADFKVSRSTVMAAPPSEVFKHVENFKSWDAWSPWAKLDPKAKVTFEGPESGKGAVMKWAGNSDVGEGSMTILESKPNELVRIKLDFIKPMEGTSTTEFLLKPDGDKTNVTWNMEGRNENFIQKAMCLVMNGQKMVGDQYDKGLANIKALVEKKPEDKKI